MALQFNPLLLGANGLPLSLVSTVMMGTSRTIKVFPSTIPFPSVCPTNTTGLPAGHILTYTNMNFSATLTPGYIVINGATGTSAAATAAGTLSWMAYSNGTGAVAMFLTDSIVMSGGNGVLSVNTLTPSNGQTVTISFALKFT